jgi:hypothetical protein
MHLTARNAEAFFIVIHPRNAVRVGVTGPFGTEVSVMAGESAKVEFRDAPTWAVFG